MGVLQPGKELSSLFHCDKMDTNGQRGTRLGADAESCANATGYMSLEKLLKCPLTPLRKSVFGGYRRIYEIRWVSEL